MLYGLPQHSVGYLVSYVAKIGTTWAGPTRPEALRRPTAVPFSGHHITLSHDQGVVPSPFTAGRSHGVAQTLSPSQVPQLEKLTKALLCRGQEVADADRARVRCAATRSALAPEQLAGTTDKGGPVGRLSFLTTPSQTSTAQIWADSSPSIHPRLSRASRGRSVSGG